MQQKYFLIAGIATDYYELKVPVKIKFILDTDEKFSPKIFKSVIFIN